ncbi:MAG: type II toxin-antitoxin system PemK/MazF family toxin [Trueperaceae bacterium]
MYWADLRPRSGSEQRGRRPVIVVSHDSLNQIPSWRSVVIVPLTTSTRQAERGPSAIPIAAGEGGLEQLSVALCHQVTTLDRRKFGECIGFLPDEIMRNLNRGLVAALDLLP